MKKSQNVTLNVTYIVEIKKRGIQLSTLLNELLGKYLGLEDESEEEKRERVVKDLQVTEDQKEAQIGEVDFLINAQLKYHNKPIDQGLLEEYNIIFGKEITEAELHSKMVDLNEKAKKGVEGFHSAEGKYPKFFK